MQFTEIRELFLNTDDLKNMSLNCMGPLTHGVFFSMQILEMEADTQGLWVSEPSSRFRMAFLIAIYSFVMKRKLGRELYPYIFILIILLKPRIKNG